jgi:hypothetical protein
MCGMASDVPNQQTRTAVTQRIIAHVAQGWPHLGKPVVRHRGKFCYVGTVLPGSEEPKPILRLRYQGSADRWAIAIYMASKERYTESELPTGSGATTGTPEEGIDHTFILYAGPSATASPAPAQAPEEDQDAETAEHTTSPAETTEHTTPPAETAKHTTPPVETAEHTTSPAETTEHPTSPAETAEHPTSPAETAEHTTPPADQISVVKEPQRRTFPWPRISIPRLKLWWPR